MQRAWPASTTRTQSCAASWKGLSCRCGRCAQGHPGLCPHPPSTCPIPYLLREQGLLEAAVTPQRVGMILKMNRSHSQVSVLTPPDAPHLFLRGSGKAQVLPYDPVMGDNRPTQVAPVRTGPSCPATRLDRNHLRSKDTCRLPEADAPSLAQAAGLGWRESVSGHRAGHRVRVAFVGTCH